jgi:hypothetical protein
MRTLAIGSLGLLTTLAWAQPDVSTRPKQLQLQLRLNGLHPQSMTLEEGRYEIRLDNAVFLAAVDFQLDDEQGRRLGETNSRARKFRTRQRLVVELRPGRHVLQVVGQPSWKTQLTVLPKR